MTSQISNEENNNVHRSPETSGARDQQDAILPVLLNLNNYASKKTLAQGMLDLALLSANAAQLKYILSNWNQHEFDTFLLCMITVSIVLQVLQAIVCIILGLIFDINQVDHQKSADIINNVALSISVVVLTVNVIISAFDIKSISNEN